MMPPRPEPKHALTAGLIALFLLFPIHSNAAPFTPELNMAFGMAVRHWGGPPTGCSSIDLQIVPDEQLAPGLDGEASEPKPGEVIPCFLYIRAELAEPQFFIRTCALMRHEVGHLEGLGHSSNPRSIMAERISLLPSECWRTSLWLINHPNYRRGGSHHA
jgi:hypothetical protein